MATILGHSQRATRSLHVEPGLEIWDLTSNVPAQLAKGGASLLLPWGRNAASQQSSQSCCAPQNRACPEFAQLHEHHAEDEICNDACSALVMFSVMANVHH